MTLHLTPDTLAAAYEYLRTTPPFRGWNLPSADEVEFHVMRSRVKEADHCRYERTAEHIIRVSAGLIKATNDLLAAMAHEMVHAKINAKPHSGPRKISHNAEYLRLARRVCKAHGWPMYGFVGG